MITLEIKGGKESSPWVPQYKITVYRGSEKLGLMRLNIATDDDQADIGSGVSIIRRLSRPELAQLKSLLRRRFPNVEELVYDEDLVLSL